MKEQKRREIFERLRSLNPHPTTELEYSTPFELLVAVILSAQATDKSVNVATRKLFKDANTPAAIRALGVEGLSAYVRSIGLYQGKAKNIIAALLLGTGAATVSDAARGLDPNVTEDDFVTAPNGTPMLSETHPVYDQFATAGFTDAGATTPLGLHVRQESWEIASAPYDDFLMLRYAITNQSAQTLQGIRVGWFFDWDLDGSTYASNRTGFDASRGLGYVWDAGSGPEAYVGIMTLTSPGTTSYRGIWNDEDHASNPSWGVYDGFTDAEKWDALSGGNCKWSARGTCGTPTAKSVTVASGSFSTVLGEAADQPMPSNLFSADESRYLEISVETSTPTVYETLSPRKRIVSGAYAMNANLLDDLDTSAVGGSAAFVPVTDSSGNLALTKNLTVDTTTLFVDSTNNRVGVGTITPAKSLGVAGDMTIATSSKIGSGNGWGDDGAGSFTTFELYNGATGYTTLNNQGRYWQPP